MIIWKQNIRVWNHTNVWHVSRVLTLLTSAEYIWIQCTRRASCDVTNVLAPLTTSFGYRTMWGLIPMSNFNVSTVTRVLALRTLWQNIWNGMLTQNNIHAQTVGRFTLPNCLFEFIPLANMELVMSVRNVERDLTLPYREWESVEREERMKSFSCLPSITKMQDRKCGIQSVTLW